MRKIFVLLVGLAAGACGGGSDSPDANLLGTDCSMGQSCGGYTCVEGLCTTTCASSDDCRAGTECREIDTALACVEKQWEGGAGKYSTNCALGGENDCAMGFRCVSVRESDPLAYCSANCTTDRDCPPEYLCGQVNTSGGVVDTCIRRKICDPCTLDENCVNIENADGRCAEDPTGPKVCSKNCDPKGETCPPNFECITEGANHCQHKSGSCFGDGSQCAPCNDDEDCADTNGSHCLRLYFSGETYCAPPCGGGCMAPFICANLGGGAQGCIAPNEWNNSCEMYWP